MYNTRITSRQIITRTYIKLIDQRVYTTPAATQECLYDDAAVRCRTHWKRKKN